MFIIQTPEMSQEEFESRMLAIREGSKEVFRTLESSLEHLLLIGAIDEAEATRIRAREAANGGLVNKQKKATQRRKASVGQ